MENAIPLAALVISLGGLLLSQFSEKRLARVDYVQLLEKNMSKMEMDITELRAKNDITSKAWKECEERDAKRVVEIVDLQRQVLDLQKQLLMKGV